LFAVITRIMFLSNSSRQVAKSLSQTSLPSRLVGSSSLQWSAFHSSARTCSEKPQADVQTEATRRMQAMISEIPPPLMVPLADHSSGSSNPYRIYNERSGAPRKFQPTPNAKTYAKDNQRPNAKLHLRLPGTVLGLPATLHLLRARLLERNQVFRPPWTGHPSPAGH